MSDARGPVAAHIRLASVPLFASLNESQLRTLAFRAEERSYRDGDTIIAQGDDGNALFVILSGQARVSRSKRPVTVLGPGQYFGEMALLDSQPRTADVTAEGPVSCLVLTAWGFWSAADHEVLRAMFKEVTRRLRASPTAFSE